MKRWIHASEEVIDINQYKPTNAIMQKLMNYRDKGSRVNVKAIKDKNKLFTYYYGAKLMGWSDLSSDIYNVASFSDQDTLKAISREVGPDEQYADTRSADDVELGLSDSKELFTFDQRRRSGAPSCWLPKKLLQYFVDNNIPVHFGKRTSGGEWDRNGAQWSEVEHLTLFPGTEDEFDYEIVVHTNERADGSIPNTYTSRDTFERVSAKQLIAGLDKRLRSKGLI